jgi:hypothetical protein
MMGITEDLNCIDSVGNRLSAIPHEKMLHLRLKLTTESKPRDIGKLFKRDGKIIYSRYTDEKNIFRKDNSWGLNYKVVETLPDDAEIELKSKLRTYTISSVDAKKSGKKHFKEQGFELQTFVPLDLWRNS